MDSSARSSSSPVTIDRAVGRAVSFLRSRQLPNGEFATLLGTDQTLANAALDSSPFVTSFVVYALTHVDSTEVDDLIGKAVSFLASEMEFGGVWRYWSTGQHKHARLPPDLDDTACISYALRRAGRPVPNNGWAFRCSRDSAGRYRTWILPTRRNCRNLRFLTARFVGYCQARMRTRRVAPPASEDPRFQVMHIDRADVDPVVNANVLLYVGERRDTVEAIQFIIDAVLAGAPGSAFYFDPLALYYAVARAFHHSSPRLGVLRQHMVSRIVALTSSPQSVNPLQAALASAALLTLEPSAPSVRDLLDVILETQRDDGGWDAYPFYNVWGSEELTTGLCLEVLARCNSMGQHDDPGFEGRPIH